LLIAPFLFKTVNKLKSNRKMKLALFILLAFTPLPFASVSPVWQWFWMLYIAVLSILGLWARKIQIFNETKINAFPHIPLLLLLLFILWGLVQALVPVQSIINLGLHNPVSGFQFISVSPTSTIKVSFTLLAHVLLFYLVFCQSHSKKFTEFIFISIQTIVTVYALYGLVIFFAGNATILWHQKAAYLDSLSSTFVNRNNFAAYAGIGLIVSIAKNLQTHSGARILQLSNGNLFQFFSNFHSSWWLSLLSIMTIMAALILTSSRAGVLSCFIGVIALFGLCLRRKLNSKSKAPMIVISLFVVIIFMALGGNVTSRLVDLDLYDQRFSIYPIALEIAEKTPYTGTGLGTFEEVFRGERSTAIRNYFKRAHNEILELLVTAGIPATLIFLSAFSLLFFRILIYSLSSGSPTYEANSCLAIMISVSVHSLVDFPMQIPAISYLFTAILGICSYQAYTTMAE